MMLTIKGRVNSLPTLFANFKKHTITIQLLYERITLFEDGTMKRYKKQIRERRR